MHCKISFMFRVFTDEIRQRYKAREFPSNITNQTEMPHINGFTNIGFLKMTGCRGCIFREMDKCRRLWVGSACWSVCGSTPVTSRRSLVFCQGWERGNASRGRRQKDEEWRGPFQKLAGEESLYSILGKGCLNLGRNH